MSFKNALKNLVAHFGVVWSLLLYIVLFAAAILGLSLPFVLPVARALTDAGVFEGITNSFRALFGEGGWQALWDGLFSTYDRIVYVFQNDRRVASLTSIFVVLILVVLFRFFLGLYEIPLATVMDGAMSCNARYGLGGKFVSTLLVSIRYSLVKMAFTIAVDTVMTLTIYGISIAMGLTAALAFLIMLVFFVFTAFRFSIVACWAPCVASGECGVIKGFIRSAGIFFKRFGSIFSSYLVSFMLIIVLGIIISLFTLGVGIIIILPFSAAYISYLNITVYYNKTGKRYYVDGAVFTPPTDNVL